MLLTLALSTAQAMEVREQWDSTHPVALGVRAAAWQADYLAPGVGGHVKWQPRARFGVEGFWNSFARPQDSLLRQDHIIGFHLYSPLVGNERHYLAPTFGTCVELRKLSGLRDKKEQQPTLSDIRFGLHAGMMAEAYLWGGFSAEATLTAYGYWGNDSQLQGWTASASNALHFSPVAQLAVGLNYWF